MASPNASSSKKRCWNVLLELDDSEADEADRDLLEPSESLSGLPFAFATSQDGPEGWIARLQAVLKDDFLRIRQERDIIMVSACSGTGCPAMALKANVLLKQTDIAYSRQRQERQ